MIGHMKVNKLSYIGHINDVDFHRISIFLEEKKYFSKSKFHRFEKKLNKQWLLNDTYLVSSEISDMLNDLEYDIRYPNQQGNYKETVRLNDDTLNRLGWEPKKDLREYILNLN